MKKAIPETRRHRWKKEFDNVLLMFYEISNEVRGSINSIVATIPTEDVELSAASIGNQNSICCSSVQDMIYAIERTVLEDRVEFLTGADPVDGIDLIFGLVQRDRCGTIAMVTEIFGPDNATTGSIFLVRMIRHVSK